MVIVGLRERFLNKNILKIKRMWLVALLVSFGSSKKPKTALCRDRSFKWKWFLRFNWSEYQSDLEIGHSKKRCLTFSFALLHKEHNGLGTRFKGVGGVKVEIYMLILYERVFNFLQAAFYRMLISCS